MGPSYSSAGAKAGDRCNTVASTGKPADATDTPAPTSTAKSQNLLMMSPVRSEPTARTPLRAKFGEKLTSSSPLTLEAHCPSGPCWAAGHQKVIIDFTLPSGSDKLSRSKDDTILVWDCQTSQDLVNVRQNPEEAYSETYT